MWTCRNGKFLDDAVEWCAARGLFFDAVNDNVDSLSFTTSNKVFAHVYIDDRGVNPDVELFCMDRVLNEKE